MKGLGTQINKTSQDLYEKWQFSQKMLGLTSPKCGAEGVSFSYLKTDGLAVTLSLMRLLDLLLNQVLKS